MGLTFANLQTGHNYLLRNYGEEIRFVVIEIISKDECKVKHVETLEVFMLSELIRYGIGDDYELYEIES